MTDGRPNVLFVLTDQWRASALGCAGNDDVETPTLDGLAAEGVRFRNAVTTKPMCTPARASIVTGTFPHINRTVYNQLRLPTEFVSVAEPLRDAGYRTGYVGKWHLDGPNSLYVPPGPRRQGFADWRGFNTTSHDYDGGHPEFDADGNATWREGYQPAVQTEVALELLEEYAASADPFFLTLSWGPPHPPTGGWSEADAPEAYSGRYDPDELSLRPNVPEDDVFVRPGQERWDVGTLRRALVEYYGYITSLDDCLARLLERLDALGIEEETLVVFTSDHGEMLGSQGRVNKGTPFEEAINVPLIVRYPGRVDGGRVSDAVASLNDLMPTILSVCGTDIPDQVQGVDLSAHLLDGASGPDRAYVEGWRVENDIPGAEDWGPWGQPWRTVRTREASLTIDHTLETQYCFDLAADPDQHENLAGAGTDLEADLREALFECAETYDDREFVTRRRYM